MATTTNNVNVSNNTAQAQAPKMDLRTYIKLKGAVAAKSAVKIRERLIRQGLVADSIEPARVDAGLRKVLGVVGVESTEQKAIIAKLLRLASWAEFEIPPATGPRHDTLDVQSFNAIRSITGAMGQTPPKLNVIAKRYARELLAANIDPEFVRINHGGETAFAVNAVLEALFPKVVGEDAKTSREAYLTKLFDEMLALLG